MGWDTVRPAGRKNAAIRMPPPAKCGLWRAYHEGQLRRSSATAGRRAALSRRTTTAETVAVRAWSKSLFTRRYDRQQDPVDQTVRNEQVIDWQRRRSARRSKA